MIQLRKLARPERFELPTARFVAEYSIQLSYGRIVCYSRLKPPYIASVAEREGLTRGILPLALRAAPRSKFALSSASCLAKIPASAIHGFGVRWAQCMHCACQLTPTILSLAKTGGA